MDWIHMEVGLPDHPKVGRLSRRLKIDRNRSLAIVVRLLCWTGRAKEDGHLNGTDPEDLADVCRWDGNPTEFVEALVGSGWLDQKADGLAVHDWMERQGRMLRARQREAARRQRDATVPHAAARCATLRGEERRGEREEKGEEPCTETGTVSPPAPAVLSFPCDGKAPTWSLTKPYLTELQELFPQLDVLAQARAALAWVKANPEKRKTAKGMPAFLTRWLTNETDSPKRDRRPPANAAPTPKKYAEWEPPA